MSGYRRRLRRGSHGYGPVDQEGDDHARPPEASPGRDRPAGLLRSRAGPAGRRLPPRRPGGRRRRGRRRPGQRPSGRAGHPDLQLLGRQGRDRDGGTRARRAGALRLRHPDRGAVAGVRRPRQGDRHRAPRPHPLRRRAGAARRHHRGGRVRLAEDVRGDRRHRAVVGAWHQDRLPRLHVRLHHRRGRPPGHWQADLAGPSRRGGRAARGRRRAVLRCPRGRPWPAGAAGGRRGHRGVACLAARRLAVLQHRAARVAADRGVRQPSRHPDGRHPRRQQELRPRRRSHVRRAAGRGGRRPAGLARPAP